jgi:nucleotide-binding universal stress UspA family protein
MAMIAESEITFGAERRSAPAVGRDRFSTNVKRILVPTDLPSESEKAIEFGLVLAKFFGAHLTLFHVFRKPYAVQYVRGPHTHDAVLQERRYFENTLKWIAEDVRKRYADCDVEFRDGEPCKEIVRMAKERGIDLIVISTHHYNWLTRLAYGCDAEKIFRHAPCPILVLEANRVDRGHL